MRFYDLILRGYVGDGLDTGRLVPASVHAHIAAVLATSCLMWAYTALACDTIDTAVPCRVGIAASVVHLLSPFAFRIVRDPMLPCSLMVGAGMVHTASFAWFTGGFSSGVLIWLAFLPWLAGLIAGWRGAVTWTILSLMMAGAFLGLHLAHYTVHDQITESGRAVAQGILLFGWILITAVMIVIHLVVRSRAETALRTQHERIERLFRSLYHDLATPLSSLALRLEHSTEDDSDRRRALCAALDIVANARAEYLAGGDATVVLSRPLDGMVIAAVRVHQPLAQAKGVTLSSDIAALVGAMVVGDGTVIAHHVLGNLLANAVKFAPPGSKIQVTGRDVDNGVLVTVRDQGCGMTPSAIVDVEAGRLAEVRTGTVGEPGGGFGLLVARSWVLRYGGTLRLRNAEGGGLEAEVLFPRAPAGPATTAVSP